MRIAVVHGLGFFYSGGGEKLVIQQVLGLRERGHEVECLAPIVDASRSYPGWLELVRARRIVPALPEGVRYRDALAILGASLAAPAVGAYLGRFDVVLAANQPAPWIAWWGRVLAGVPYVAYLAQPNRLLWPRAIDLAQRLVVKRDYELLRAVGIAARPAIVWADARGVRGAAVALANGPYMAGVLTELYGRAFRSCPAGAAVIPGEADRTRGEVRVNGTVVRKPFVLLTNRHYPQKRFEVAVDVLRQGELQRRGIELVITGQETAYTRALRTQVESNGLRGKVHFVGLASETDLARLYANAACYVYPSPEEDYGMGIVEAMGAGTPVVAWDFGGPTGTVVDGETGYLVAPGDATAFAERVAALVTDGPCARRLGANAQAHVRERLTLAHHLDLLENALVDATRP